MRFSAVDPPPSDEISSPGLMKPLLIRVFAGLIVIFTVARSVNGFLRAVVSFRERVIDFAVGGLIGGSEFGRNCFGNFSGTVADECLTFVACEGEF